jgi:hypothetical protein
MLIRFDNKKLKRKNSGGMMGFMYNPEAEFRDPDWGDQVNPGKGLSHRLLGLAGRS